MILTNNSTDSAIFINGQSIAPEGTLTLEFSLDILNDVISAYTQDAVSIELSDLEKSQVRSSLNKFPGLTLTLTSTSTSEGGNEGGGETATSDDKVEPVRNKVNAENYEVQKTTYVFNLSDITNTASIQSQFQLTDLIDTEMAERFKVNGLLPDVNSVYDSVLVDEFTIFGGVTGAASWNDTENVIVIDIVFNSQPFTSVIIEASGEGTSSRTHVLEDSSVIPTLRFDYKDDLGSPNVLLNMPQDKKEKFKIYVERKTIFLSPN